MTADRAAVIKTKQQMIGEKVKLKKYAATITWEWGLKEIKFFLTKEERENFVKENEEIIDSCRYCMTNKNGKINSARNLKESESFYSPNRNWTDYEMDVYL